MWSSIAQRVTDLIFRMEQLDEGFVGSTWVETSAVHEEAPSTSEIAQQQDEAIDASQSEREDRADPQPRAARRPQRSVPLRQRQEVQELLSASLRSSAGTRC